MVDRHLHHDHCHHHHHLDWLWHWLTITITTITINWPRQTLDHHHYYGDHCPATLKRPHVGYSLWPKATCRIFVVAKGHNSLRISEQRPHVGYSLWPKATCRLFVVAKGHNSLRISEQRPHVGYSLWPKATCRLFVVAKGHNSLRISETWKMVTVNILILFMYGEFSFPLREGPLYAWHLRKK